MVIGNTSFRLHGIDAPETDQQCLNAKCFIAACGIDARDRLKAHIAGREVCCVDKGSGAYGRRAAVCSVDGEDLNAWLVQEGLARAYSEVFGRLYWSKDNDLPARQGAACGAVHSMRHGISVVGQRKKFSAIRRHARTYRN